MTRIERTAWAILAAVGTAAAAESARAITPAQHWGVGYGAGYHACRTCGKCKAGPPIGFGVQDCCEYPLNMQLHVWDGYEYEPHLWRRHARQFKYLEPPVVPAHAAVPHGAAAHGYAPARAHAASPIVERGVEPFAPPAADDEASVGGGLGRSEIPPAAPTILPAEPPAGTEQHAPPVRSVPAAPREP